MCTYNNGSVPRVTSRAFFSFYSFLLLLFFILFLHFYFPPYLYFILFFVLVLSCRFRVITHTHTHTQLEMTRYIGKISSHDSDRTRMIEIYILYTYKHTCTQRDDTPQWLTASVITSFNFHTFSFLLLAFIRTTQDIYINATVVINII